MTTSIDVCADGPLLIRGPIEIRDESGELIPVRRSVVALCRCGKSRIKPFCDATHLRGRNGTSRSQASLPVSRNS